MHVDLNSDVGESYGRWTLGDDDAVLRVVTSANVACGFHAGDPSVLRATCRSAVQQAVVIGAQVGYGDLAGFGRRFVDVAPADLEADVIYQIGGLDAIARTVGGRVRYVKPHGALYHATVDHAGQAEAVVRAVATLDRGLPVLGPPGSMLLEAARAAGLRTVAEAFADRGYRSDGRLVPRGEPGAVLSDPETVARRAVRMVTEGRVEAVDGSDVDVAAGSLCLHGDTPDAVGLATAVAGALTGAGVELRAFG
ncbi:UPF0271 protein [Mumia flava]|uniref:5-oxoprolinase subunit A n=1 Tax=Mumia flava TaxID=1348852 RepID=A0A0B2BLF3_9ACTN|nr:5-oxoprolinase subunit PxpA [Mumia flava]PJJ56426.1 UPF0271 protein [Mumia flava]